MQDYFSGVLRYIVPTTQCNIFILIYSSEMNSMGQFTRVPFLPLITGMATTFPSELAIATHEFGTEFFGGNGDAKDNWIVIT